MKIPDDLARSCLTPRTLGLIVMPTEQCNFRCTYCYEDFAMGRMSAGIVAGLKAFLSTRAAELDELYLSWFGGEPLIALDIVEDVQRHALSLAAAHPGLRVGSNMTTNAWRLGPQVFGRLLALGVDDYQISFDGPKQWHDKKRVRAGGQPSFDRLWKNVLAMRERPEPFLIRLRLHVDHENLDDMFPFVDHLLDTFGLDPRFGLFLKSLSRYGGPNDASMKVLSGEDDMHRFAELEQRIARARPHAAPSASHAPLPGTTLSGPAALEADAARIEVGAGAVCYASRGNHFVVRSDGRLCKCTIVLDHPRNQVGRLHEDGRVEVSGAAMQPWMRGLWSGNRAELLCPMLGLAEPYGGEDRPGSNTSLAQALPA